MANHFIFSIAFCVLLCHLFCPVQTADECKTNADCKSSWFKFCCRGFFGDKQRSCTYGSCLYNYCSNDSDCGDASLCCRSNKCVKDGCSGCTDDGNCSSRHVCCKKTFPLNQTVCGSNCINQSCNHNDDCGGYYECCRSGKCVTSGCNDRCASNSDCDLGEYCCKKEGEETWYRGESCSRDCVGENCGSDEDCGGPGECCISTKCVTEGCHGCNLSADCSSGHYCCKKKEWYELNECSADCLGKSCSTDNDCGGPQERCDSDNRCLPKTKSESISTKTESSNSLPSWAIAVIVVTFVVFLIAVGVIVALCWYLSKVRRQNRTGTGRGVLSLENTGRQADNAQPLTQFPRLNNPTAQEGSGLQHQPTNQGTENSAFYNATAKQQNQPAVVPNFNQAQSINNPLTNHIYHTVESPDTPHHGIQYYPQNPPYQQGDSGSDNPPPYNPQYYENP